MASWFSHGGDTAPGSSRLGPLEWRVLEALWQRDDPAAVRDLIDAFPGVAYTTLMTTLDRLYRKRVLSRERRGRAFAYRPCWSRAEFESSRAGDAVRSALARCDGSLAPLASCLIDAVGDRDRELLDALEALVAARRTEAADKS